MKLDVRFENSIAVFAVDADSVVLNIKDVAAGELSDFDTCAEAFGEFHGVVKQVPKANANESGVCVDLDVVLYLDDRFW